MAEAMAIGDGPLALAVGGWGVGECCCRPFGILYGPYGTRNWQGKEIPRPGKARQVPPATAALSELEMALPWIAWQ